MDNIDHIDYFIKLLKKMEQRSKKAVDLGVAGDEVGVRYEVDALRSIHHEVNAYNTSFLDSLSSDPIHSSKLDLIVNLKSKIARYYQFINQWAYRYVNLLDFNDMVKSDQLIMGHIDSVVPLIWDWSRDILVLVGSFPDKYLSLLMSRGQKNILVIGGHKSNFSGLKNLIFVEDLKDIRRSLSIIERPLPTKSAFVYNDANFDQDILQSKVNDALNSLWMNVNTINFFENRWVEQGIHNLYDIAKSFNWTELRGQTNKNAAIIVSPGPSLNNNLHLLAKAGEKAYLICVAQALPTLINNNIYPDLVVVIDPVDYSHILQDLEINFRCDLLMGASCNSAFRRLSFKNFYIFDGSSLSDRWILNIFNDEPVGASGGSVSVSSLLFAIRFGFKSIALVGQDLSITDGMQYAKDSPLSNIDVTVFEGVATIDGFQPEDINALSDDEKIKLGIGSSQNTASSGSYQRVASLIPVRGFYGGTVYSLPDYYQYYLEFIEIARKFKEHVALYNCTEGGVFIDNFTHSSLADFLNALPEPIGFSPKIMAGKFDERMLKLESFLSAVSMNMKYLYELCVQLDVLLSESIDVRNNYSSRISSFEKNILDTMSKIPFLELGMQKDLDSALAGIRNSADLDSAIAVERHLLNTIMNNIQKLSVLLETYVNIGKLSKS